MSSITADPPAVPRPPFSPLYRLLTAPFRAGRRTWEELVSWGLWPDGMGRHRILVDMVPVAELEGEFALAEAEMLEAAEALAEAEAALLALPVKAAKTRDQAAALRLVGNETTRLKARIETIRLKRVTRIAERVGEGRNALEALHRKAPSGVWA